jgi:energy-coupling factor transporter ATP-binding protein EcfA2
MKAQTLPEVVRFFDPMHSLSGQGLKDWYIDRPGDPLRRMKIYLQGLGLNNEPTRILFSGHVGSGKSTALNKLAGELKQQFLIVPFDVRQAGGIADLNYVDVVLGIATSLFKRATEPDVLDKAPAQIAADFWADLTGFIEEVIVGPAHFRTSPPQVEASARVNFLAVEFQTKFASEASTRDAVREAVEGRLSELYDRINMVADRVGVSYKRPVLFFVEGTDKADIARARDIFVNHTYALTAFRASVVYTFPITLRYSAADFNQIKDYFETFVLPNLKIADRDGTRNDEGRQCLSAALMARMEEPLVDPAARDRIIQSSGGLMRSLVRLTQRSAVNAIAGGKDAITTEAAESAIEEERADFVAGLSRDDYPVLYARHQDKMLSGDADVLRLLETRALLEYANGEPWCDVHPVALELVEERAPTKKV